MISIYSNNPIKNGKPETVKNVLFTKFGIEGERNDPPTVYI